MHHGLVTVLVVVVENEYADGEKGPEVGSTHRKFETVG
jgi:hypothetical protein